MRHRPLRIFSALFLSALASAPRAALFLAQNVPPPTRKPTYTLAGVDVYGNRAIPPADIVALLGVKQGTEVTPALVVRLEDQLKSSGKFAFAKVTSTSYGDRKSYLTVDVVEKGDEKLFPFNASPTGNVQVTASLLDWVRQYQKATYEAVQHNRGRLEDINEGHYLNNDPDLRKFEEKMLEMVPQHYDVLVRALQEDRDPAKRSLCAVLLGWAPDKVKVLVPLQKALKDPEVQVRASAARSLIPIAYLSSLNHFPFPLAPVLDQLHYPTVSDRTKAAGILVQLAGEPGNQAQIRGQAGEILVKMAEANQPSSRDFALILLSEISGEKYGTDVAKWKAWWAEQQKKGPPAETRGAPAGKPGARP